MRRRTILAGALAVLAGCGGPAAPKPCDRACYVHRLDALSARAREQVRHLNDRQRAIDADALTSLGLLSGRDAADLRRRILRVTVLGATLNHALSDVVEEGREHPGQPSDHGAPGEQTAARAVEQLLALAHPQAYRDPRVEGIRRNQRVLRARLNREALRIADADAREAQAIPRPAGVSAAYAQAWGLRRDLGVAERALAAAAARGDRTEATRLLVRLVALARRIGSAAAR